MPQIGIIITELQTREGNKDKSKIKLYYFSMETYVVTPHWKRLGETVLMRGHKICFYGKIWLIISKLSLLPLLICSIGIHLLSV